MKSLRAGLAAGLALALFSSLAAAQEPGQCIVAGRLAQGQWAPRFTGVQLLGGDGRAIASASKDALAAVRQARLAQPALLSRCDGNGPLPQNDNDPAAAKERVPAVSPGLVEVEAVSYPRLRTGGELVELRLRVPAERTVLVMR